MKENHWTAFIAKSELDELARQQQTHFRANVNTNLSDKNKNTPKGT